MSPSPSTAVPFETTATRLPRAVSSAACRVGDDRLAGGGDARRIGERQVALVAERLGRLDLELSRPRQAVIDQRARAQIVGQIRCQGFLRKTPGRVKIIYQPLSHKLSGFGRGGLLTAFQIVRRGHNDRENASRSQPCGRRGERPRPRHVPRFAHIRHCGQEAGKLRKALRPRILRHRS